MKKNNTDRILLVISVCCFFLMSLSFSLMPVDVLGMFPGIMFWVGLAGGILLQVILEMRRRRFYRQMRVNRERMQKTKNGLLSFASSSLATIADYATGIGFVATMLSLIITKGYGIMCYVLITITIFSFCLHCILNGRILFYVNNKEKVRLMLEMKKANKQEKGEGEL